MKRRTFLRTVAAASVAGGVTASTDTPLVGTALADAGSACTAGEEIASLEFYSPASQLDANYGPLTDSSVVAVWAEPSATNVDDDGNGDAHLYDANTSIPLASVDGSVYGFGAILLQDANVKFEFGNEEFVLNAWDAEMGGSGTVLWDEGHGQFFDLASCSGFHTYAENNGYTVQATSSLSSDLSTADGVVVTSPTSSFSSSELADLANFVSNGGALYLHDQSDYSDNDGTGHLNDIAEHLGLAFRFNDDDINDGSSNYDGNDYDVLTHQFNDDFDLFGARSGISLDAGVRYRATVTDVTDGDTVDVQLDVNGTEYNVRTLGFDSPETRRNGQYENIDEWEGIEDDKHLADWAKDATNYATQELDGETVEIEVDPSEDVYDVYGRLLAYIYYDQDGDGTIDTLYNEEIVREGYARVYGSSLAKHDDIWQAERDARDAGRGVWSQSDPANSSEVRDRAVQEVFVPNAASVRLENDTSIPASRTPVFAENTAYQQLEGGVSYADIPLVGVDSANNTALVGGLPIDEGLHGDASSYEHEVFLTNLIDSLSAKSGQILIEGGHGQFNETYSLSNEDAVNYQRYLEGQGITFEQVNTLDGTGDNALSTARAVIVTSPRSCYTTGEVTALTDFIASGGAVVLMGAGVGKVAPDTRSNLNDLAGALGSDLRLNEDRVLDDTNNVGDPELLYTTNLNTSFSLWSAYT